MVLIGKIVNTQTACLLFKNETLMPSAFCYRTTVASIDRGIPVEVIKIIVSFLVPNSVHGIALQDTFRIIKEFQHKDQYEPLENKEDPE